MSDQAHEEARPSSLRPWDGVRRLREPLASTLLALTLIRLAISAWELFGLPGTPPIAGRTVSATTFGLRASAVAPQFVDDGIFSLPLLSVVLVVFAGGMTGRARPVVETAIFIQAVTLGLGVLSWLGALSAHVRSGIWFTVDATELATVAVGLVFTVAVRRSPRLQRPMPQYNDFADDEDAGEELP